MRRSNDFKRVDVRARGNEWMIAPLHQTSKSFSKDGLQATDEVMTERVSQNWTPREAF